MAGLSRVTCGLSRFFSNSAVRCSYQGLTHSSHGEESRVDCKLHSKLPLYQQTRGIRSIFRCSDDDPSTHTTNQEGLFYTIPDADYDKYLTQSFTKSFRNLGKVLQERCIMVRQPGLDIIDNLKCANYEMPVLRHVLYGRSGVGKTTSLAHVIHYCATQGWVVLFVPWAAHFGRYCKEMQHSTWKTGRVDQPYEAAELMSQFLKMNKETLIKHDVRLKGTYRWSKREVAEAGSPIVEMIDFGLGRTKYATDILGVLLKELKMHASGDMKVLVAVDAVNAFWEQTRIRWEYPAIGHYQANDLTIVQQFKKILKNDWKGGAVVATVDGVAVEPEGTKEYMPGALLGKEGFELLDPHIPVLVPAFSDKEAISAIEYFVDRKWITTEAAKTEDGLRELMFLSSKNPEELYNVSRRW